MKSSEIKQLIADNNVAELAKLIKDGTLVIADGKIKYRDKDYAKATEEYWDKRQLVRKYALNSLYGSLLSPSCRFFDQRIGQSTTLSGRQVVKHMISSVNEIITGEYDHVGDAVIYGDTDSEIGSTIHLTNVGEKTIEELFNCGNRFYNEATEYGVKEYSMPNSLETLTYNPCFNEIMYGEVNYIYRHKVCKDLYEIEDESGNIVTVTEDHSVMVERDGNLVQSKPADIRENDNLISVDDSAIEKSKSLKRAPVKSVSKIRKANNEYVYDIGMKDHTKPWFFGNNILLHNSCYFSAYNTLKNDIDSSKIKWDKDSVIELYDQIGNIVNGTFIDFMLKTFHCPKERGSVIRAGRELVALKGLYITKKRYAVLYFDKEGKRTDINNKPGKVKAMGLDLRRADTPEFMQDFLNEILLMVLTNEPQDAVLTRITEFRNEFKQRPGWEKGTPKRVNNLTAFKDKEAIKKTNMPGHVRASINWNTLRKLFDDKYSMAITDGQKTIVCKLKNNSLGMTSVAYPIDELRVPQWFKELPFDHEAMEQIIIDHKIDNLIGVLNYDLESTRTANSFNDLFDFE